MTINVGSMINKREEGARNNRGSYYLNTVLGVWNVYQVCGGKGEEDIEFYFGHMKL